VWVCVREPGSSRQTGYLNWSGTARAKKQGHPAISYEDEGVYKTSQGCHTRKRTALHLVVKRPVGRPRYVPLMKGKFFRTGQVWSGVVWREKLFDSDVLSKYDIYIYVCVCVCVVRWYLWYFAFRECIVLFISASVIGIIFIAAEISRKWIFYNCDSNSLLFLLSVYFFSNYYKVITEDIGHVCLIH
jgi:hypothetical protein